MKKRVRIYKAPDGQGKVMNSTAKWMAQMGGQQQDQMQQVYNFIAQSLNQGNDPETVTMQLIQAGIDESTATNLVMQVAEQLGQTEEVVETQETPQVQTPETFEELPTAQPTYEDNTYTYDEAEQMMDGDEGYYQQGGSTPEELVMSQYQSAVTPVNAESFNPAVTQDYAKLAEFMESLATPSLQDYMIDYKPVSDFKKGGATKKTVKKIMSLYEEGGDVMNDKIGRGNMMDTATDDIARKKEGFLNAVKTSAKEAKAKELYDLMLNSSDPSLQQNAMQFSSDQFMQTGGFTDNSNPDLYKFIYGGNEDVPYYEADFLPEAQTGEEVRRATINYIPQRRTVPGGLRHSLLPFNPIRSVRYLPFSYNAGMQPIQIPLDQKGLKEIYKGKSKESRTEKTKETKDKDSRLRFYPGSFFPGFQGSAFAREQVVTPDEFDVYSNNYSFNPTAPGTMPEYEMSEYMNMPDVQPEQGYYPSKNWLNNFLSGLYAQGGLVKAQVNNSQVGSPIDVGFSPDGTAAIQGVPPSSWAAGMTEFNSQIPTNPFQQPIQYEKNEYMGGPGTPLGIDKQGFGVIKETTTDPEAGVMAVDTALNAMAGIAERLQTPKPRQFYGDDIAASASKQYNVGTWDVNSGLFRPNQAGFMGVVQKGGFLPQAKTGQQVQGALAIQPTAMGGADTDQYIGKPNMKVTNVLTADPRDRSNLEAEGGETAYGDINGDGLPEHKIIKGPRHAQGGVPLSLPDDTFIFSDYKRGNKGEKSMKINDPDILAQFGKGGKKGEKGKGFTPAELAKQYDVEKYRKILQDPDSDRLERSTAELMIKNYVMKLGALALAQESKKGFPQGIPVAALPYMEAMGLRPEDVLPQDMQATIDQLKAQEEQAMQTQTMASPTGYEDAMMAQQMNQGQPVAMPQMNPQDMQMPMAMYGMEMGGYDLPFAEYGMTMGANPNNYMGRAQYAKGGYLPKHQTTGQTGSEKVVINRADYDNEADFERAVFIANRQGKQVYVVNNNQRQKVKGFTPRQLSTEGITTSDFGDTPQALQIAAQYQLLENSIKDPFVRKQIIEQTKASLNDPKAYVGKTAGAQGKTWSQRGFSEPTEDQIIKSFLTHQKRNMMLQAKGIDPRYFNDTGRGFKSADQLVKDGLFKTTQEAENKLKEISTTYGSNADAVSQSLGIPLGSGWNDKALEQAAYHGYVRTLQKKNKGEYTPEEQYALRSFDIAKNATLEGQSDETSMTSLYGTDKISPIDAVQGDTTLGHLAMVGQYGIDYDNSCQCADGTTKEKDANGKCPCEEKIQKKCPCQTSNGTVIDTGINPNTGECNPCEENINIPIEETAPLWLQDTIKTAGAFGDLMSLNKYMPWAPMIDFTEPEPVYLDPTRELAQQSEQANIITEGLAQFVGPQALSARASQVQGQGAKQAADTLARYNNANVNTANQFALKIADIRNQESAANQAIASKLYDQTTIANQQFDNSKRQARANLGNYYVNAITNRSKTDALNQLYPQYSVDPSTGGFMTFDQGKALTGTGTDETTDFDYWLKYYKGQNMKDTDAISAAKAQSMKSVSSNPYAGAQAAYAAQYAGMTPGYSQKGGQAKDNYMIFGNFDFPFIL